jgi:pimeloyl-ACP methyl ester carboxylesterase
MVPLLLTIALAQAGEPYSLRTARGPEPSTMHRIQVAENRVRPDGARITLAVVRLPATARATRPPVFYLAGGPGQSGIAAAQLSDTYDVLQRIRRTADVLLLDQRGTGQSVPRLSCAATRPLPSDVFESSAAMQRALEPGLRECLEIWRTRGIDLAAYNTEASADDVADVAKALGLPHISLFGFSYGTHLAASVVRRHPDLVDRVAFAGFEGPDDNEKYPAVYDRQIAKISALAAAQPDVAAAMPDFTAALKAVLARAEQQPFEIALDAGEAAATLRIGKDGLLYLLRRDVGDTNDLPVFPKMIWQLSRNDTTLLAQYARRRYRQLGTGVSVMSLAMDCASGASAARVAEIAAQLPTSIFGSMTNPLPSQCAVLGVPKLPGAYRAPIVTRIPALFVSGTLDSNTPPEQVERALPGFGHAAHLVVEFAGHESTLVPQVADAIAAFLRGEAVTSRAIKGPPLLFESLR